MPPGRAWKCCKMSGAGFEPANRCSSVCCLRPLGHPDISGHSVYRGPLRLGYASLGWVTRPHLS
ncbi:hypothetical protein KUF71_020864, partial [Frankliniella fusca]